MIDIGPDEKIILKIRRHWFVVFSHAFSMAVMALLPLGFYFVFIRSASFLFIEGEPLYLVIAVESMWLLFVWLLFCKFWVDYYLDILVVTDKRIVDIEQIGFFNRRVSTVRLEKIQDITIAVRGILGSMLKFGEIRIQSAGEAREFLMKDVPNPYHIKETVLKLSDAAISRSMTINS
ncbi:MAG: hypothetical protein A3B99_05160 [Candidatus Yanofskybacteria bacterium RIFCSPHIGHO2_02_FULL_44_12b]|uniref:YdbS-like PH domain-containing protein n=2 Tax=Candidatus Yanofskyibacteriota TaxID=1752733 RepID=A0A1F8GL29_9BACT|nr:MAG: hypothetical protein UW79_C0023G0027 [Candidatus Yanofskybacteria bacterium GW2011_GWA2_44_9]OGN04269.1 MAG: hypothetical protein A2659_03215 [Candidatus Yanofskybacteria bacterium RIFCSPHIGHO2_01_FULL_44_24]OGN14375.1 MAG: hypothetical protein A3B99_05160 [Candidatus Yanofskybacteria bacterium RIFCSPHIGHO2_02_FULL_44_12b]OGN25376.1 MAG: hypothetical protein A2925_00725 [Candidatus Yanofskybacteria bacterium RIFCSPLOWO2_01_FULL_44_22]